MTPRRARSVGIYVMAGRVDIRDGSRDVQLHAISEVQRSCGLDVQDATWQVALRLGRRVNDERAHDHNTTGRNGAVHGRDLRRQPSDVRFRQQAECVRPGKHAQRPVVCTRIIQVQAQRHHLRQHTEAGARA